MSCVKLCQCGEEMKWSLSCIEAVKLNFMFNCLSKSLNFNYFQGFKDSGFIAVNSLFNV